MKKKEENTKICPKCGYKNSQKDYYCKSCDYNFSQNISSNQKVEKINLKSIKSKIPYIIGVILAICIYILLNKIFYGGSEINSNDGKCDICGRPASSYSPDSNEYCQKHLEDAVEHYLN